MTKFSRDELISLSKICHKNNCHHDVISYMKEVIKMGTPLNFHEREMLFNSYDELIRPYMLSFDSSGESGVDEKLQKEINRKAKLKVNRLCNEVIKLLDSDCVKSDTSIEAFAHYKCFRASQHKCKGIVASGKRRQLEIWKSLSLKEEAYEIGKTLKRSHPVAVFTALEFSTLHFDLTETKDKNLAIASEAYIKGMRQLSEVSGELKSRAEKLLEQLDENIQEWTEPENIWPYRRPKISLC